MPVFSYKALGTDGAVSTGEIDAADRTEALRLLDRQGLQPVTLRAVVQRGARRQAAQRRKPAKERNGSRRPRSATRHGGRQAAEEADIPEGPIKLKRAEVVLFTEELSDMLGAGLQLEPALRSMEKRQELGNLKAVATKIRQIVRDGNNFSTALRADQPEFRAALLQPGRGRRGVRRARHHPAAARRTTSRRSPSCRPA